MKDSTNSKFYEYRQINSGGSFSNSEKDGICEYVIIEALNADHANTRAETIGLYFNGCEEGLDCPCCGDRWYRADESNGSEVPSIYGKPVEETKKSLFRKYCFVHYLDGTFKKVEFQES